MHHPVALIRPTDRLFGQFLRYVLVGGISFVVDMCLLVTLTEMWGVDYLASAAIGFFAGLATNYLLSITWVFEARAISDPLTEFLVFAAIGLGGLALTEAFLWIGSEWLLVDYRITKVATVVVVLIWNFGLRKWILFRGR